MFNSEPEEPTIVEVEAGVTNVADDALPSTAIVGLLPVPKISAQAGKVHLGFDPPNLEEDGPDEPYWASVTKGGTNDILTITFANAQLASQVELQIAEGDDTHVDINPKVFADVGTNLTITGKEYAGEDIQEPSIKIIHRPSGAQIGTLNVMVLPPVTLELGLYTLEDPNSAKTQITHALNWNDAIGVCNDVFKQSGVQFTLHESSGPADPVGAGTTKGPNGKRFFPYDTAALVPIFPDLYPPGFFDRHDLPPYPPQVKNDNPNGIEGVKPGPAYDGSEEEGTPHQEKPAKAITMSGSPDVEGKLPWLHGRWMRHEDW